jgi:hypothetical protein
MAGGSNQRYMIEDVIAWRYGNLCYYATIVALLIFAVSGIFYDDTYRAVWGFCAALLAALPAVVEWKKGWIFPWFAKFLVGLSLVMHIGGGIESWYFSLYPIYDKIAHLVSAMTIALLVFLLLLFLEYYGVVHPGRRTIVFLIVFVTLFFGLSWEIAEWSIDQNLLSTYWVNFNDSVFDTIFNLIGVGYIAFHANEYLKAEPPEKLYPRFVKRRL